MNNNKSSARILRAKQKLKILRLIYKNKDSEKVNLCVNLKIEVEWSEWFSNVSPT